MRGNQDCMLGLTRETSVSLIPEHHPTMMLVDLRGIRLRMTTTIHPRQELLLPLTIFSIRDRRSRIMA